MDNSFLKLYRNDFQAAINNENQRSWDNRYTGFVQMLPTETFLQITNCARTIAFGGNIEVHIIDICGNKVMELEVGLNFFYDEFTDIFGVGQIKFKFGRFGIDFGEELLFLRLTHTASDKVWYSAPFMITANNERMTKRFTYRNESYFRGISYDVINDFQTIRIQCFLNDQDSAYEKEEVIQLSGAKISSRSVITPLDKYVMYQCDVFTYKRMVVLLDHDIIYIDNFRISNKPSVIKTERITDSNFFDISFEATPIEEKYSPLFAYEVLIPFGSYLPGELPQTITAFFNQDITIGVGNLYVFDADDNLLATYTNNDINPIGANGFEIPSFAGLIAGLGEFYITFDEELILSENDQTISFEWPFDVSEIPPVVGDWMQGDWNANDFFVN